MKMSDLITCINAINEALEIINFDVLDFDYEVNGPSIEAISNSTRLLICRRSSSTDVRLRVFLNYQNYIKLDAWDRFTVCDKLGEEHEVNHENIFHLMMDNDHILDHTQIKNLEKLSNKIDGFSIKIYLNN
ncbi:hypothetical protein XaC1_208 [Xanthomonas phage XaC1]|nr:hypothetical protein XaC1_208 [Xanthomonas phage XaC1]